jgi:succinate dehydrogenase/fumarate reductase cytochrome b subunit
MWSWVLHRITGATIFFFLFVHVLDTSGARVLAQRDLAHFGHTPGARIVRNLQHYLGARTFWVNSQ